MRNINAPKTESSVVRNLTLLLALTSLVTGCRNKLIERIDSTVGNLESNCAALLDSPGIKTITTSNNFIGITGQDSSCGCETTESHIECTYVEPDKTKGGVNTQRHFKVEAGKGGGYVRTHQRNQYKESGAQIGLVKMEGLDVCVSSVAPAAQVGVTPQFCKEKGAEVEERLHSLDSKLKDRDR